MPGVFDPSIFDEPESAEPSAPVKRFKVAPTFVIDLTISALYVAAVAPVWRAARGAWIDGPSLALGMAILTCYAAKIAVVSHLDRRGGDARAYVKSGVLVTDGPYAWSRHPTYALALLQFLLWSALALLLQAAAPWNVWLLGAAFGLPLAFFFINDRIVMPAEEAMLRRLHPAAFDAYAARAPRWLGRAPSQPP